MTDGLEAAARAVVHGLGAAPGAVIAAATLEARAVVGAGVVAPGEAPVDEHVVYDLASVTKSFVAVLAARLVAAGVVRWDERLGDAVGEARGTPSEDATLELLLAHRAGLQAHIPIFAPLLMGRPIVRSEALAFAARSRRSACVGAAPTGGFPPVYSDVGYLLAGELLATKAGAPLDALLERHVTSVVGSGARPASRLGSAVVAPTEHAEFRGGIVRGAVHDENAWAYSGLGLSGHAGLFGAAGDVLAFGLALLRSARGLPGAILGAAELDVLTRERPGGTLRAGFDGRSAAGSSAGERFGPRSFGHLGFTGTSLWVDPDRGLVAVLLTNRVHPTRENTAIRAARPLVHDAIAAWQDGLQR